MTPYLIISDSVNTALATRPSRGWTCASSPPHIPDKALVFELTRSHYESLLEAGVQILSIRPALSMPRSWSRTTAAEW